MCWLLNHKTIICVIFLVFYINVKLSSSKKFNILHSYLNESSFRNEKKREKYPYYYVKYNTYQKNDGNGKNIKRINISRLHESNNKRPERKLDAYELNIRNDKKFSKYAKKPASPMSNLFYFSPFKNIISSFEPVNYDIKKKLREDGFQFTNEKSESNIFPSLDDIIKDGDPSTNIHLYRRKKLKSLLYGDPSKFANTKKVIEKYNKHLPPEKQIDYDSFNCDIFYVHSDGTIMNIEENRSPYDKKLEEKDKHQEPRFVIMAQAGHAKELNLKVGDKFPIVNEEHKKTLYDNHFAKPKKIRDPLVLPDGRKIP
ncbi:conserved Plasmodium protein, unknown function [Plasmodium chabaudi adami]|uniref:Uncharacterized protein n=1 Tax=Plasmodium chabaudi adami TaxID=5826 RepID=A0A1C6XXQ6_PLACE|nr:conserved Plasmodium protein, unknown function [Plasmodium chabaudi adami]SCM13148.1 conserved Plasmodium protein, unknown function [Plasmodium chabaudi adami]